MPEPQAETAPAYSLFDGRSVWIATFFGSPVAGVILAAMNYRRLGKSAAGTAMVAGGVLLTALLVLLGFAVPADSLRFAPVVVVVAVAYGIKALQGAAVTRHVSLGGKLASRWTAFGIAIGLCRATAPIAIPIPKLSASQFFFRSSHSCAGAHPSA